MGTPRSPMERSTSLSRLHSASSESKIPRPALAQQRSAGAARTSSIPRPGPGSASPEPASRKLCAKPLGTARRSSEDGRRDNDESSDATNSDRVLVTVRLRPIRSAASRLRPRSECLCESALHRVWVGPSYYHAALGAARHTWTSQRSQDLVSTPASVSLNTLSLMGRCEG